MLLPAAHELLASNPHVDTGILAVIPFLIALLFMRSFVNGSADRTLDVR